MFVDAIKLIVIYVDIHQIQQWRLLRVGVEAGGVDEHKWYEIKELVPQRRRGSAHPDPPVLFGRILRRILILAPYLHHVNLLLCPIITHSLWLLDQTQYPILWLLDCIPIVHTLRVRL